MVTHIHNYYGNISTNTMVTPIHNYYGNISTNTMVMSLHKYYCLLLNKYHSSVPPHKLLQQRVPHTMLTSIHKYCNRKHTTSFIQRSLSADFEATARLQTQTDGSIIA